MDFNFLRNETLGHGSYMEGPYGRRLLTYADYTASGKCLRFMENYFLKLNETYANTHTKDDYTGKLTTQLYHDAKEIIRNSVGASEKYCVFPIGTGVTGAIDKLIKILGIYKTPEYWRQKNRYLEQLEMDPAEKVVIKKYEEGFEANSPVIFISSYEHHSNEIQWREGYAEVVKIGLDQDGLFDLIDLRKKVSSPEFKKRMKIGVFSAASNVTGIKSPVYQIARIMHENGGFVIFDYAASGPYVKIDMTRDDISYFDGIVLSMHKFIGGPGAAGLLILNQELYNPHNVPCSTGGGTVKYVTEDDHKYLEAYEQREDAGTPGIMQTFRAAMALQLKEIVGIERIEKIEAVYIKKALQELNKTENIEILGNTDPEHRIAVISFNIRYKEGYLHHAYVAKLLNDLFGIQSRAGCACAGPYGINLLNIRKERVEKFKRVLLDDINSMKPGWTRLNFHYTLGQATFNYIIEAIKFVAKYGHDFLEEYRVNRIEGNWEHKEENTEQTTKLNIMNALQLKKTYMKPGEKEYHKLYKQYLNYAYQKRKTLKCNTKHQLYAEKTLPDIAWFYHAESE